MNVERSNAGPVRAERGSSGFGARPIRFELPVITFEHIGYAVLAAIALALRLLPVGRLTDPSDALRAATALQAARGVDIAAGDIVGTRALFVAERIAFLLLPDGVTSSRLVPALCGVAVVLLMRRFSTEIGQVGAISAAAVVAVGPIWIAQGRGVTDGSIATLAIVLLTSAIMARRPFLTAGAAALVIATLGWTALPLSAAAGAAALSGVLRRGARGPSLVSMWPDSPTRGRAALLFVITLVLITTSFMTRPGDLVAGLSGGLVSWIEGLGAGGGAVGGYLVPLAVYAPVSVAFGLPGLVRLARTGRFFGLWLVIWAVLAVGVGVVSGAPAAVPEVLVPLTFGAGLSIGRLLETMWRAARWSEDGVMIGLALIVTGYGLLNAMRYADTGLVVSSEAQDPLRLALGSLGLLGILAVALIVLWGPAMALRVVGSSALCILGALALSNGFHLNYGVSAELLRRERIESGATALAEDLERYGPSAVIGIDPGLAPIIAWSVRDVPGVAWSGDSSREDLPDTLDALVLADGGRPAEDGREWSGRRYVVASRWSPSFLDLQGFLRWYLQRRVAEGVAGALLADPPIPIAAEVFVRVR